MHNKLTYKRFGNSAVLIEWSAIISEEILEDILSFKQKIFLEKKIVFLEIVQGYNSLTIIYTKDDFNFNKEVQVLKELYISTLKKEQQDFFQWEIPVCYDPKFGIDLQEISLQKKIAIDQIIQLHSATIYRVYFIGFLPGFLYLGGLDEQLFVDRKSNPRLNVLKGAVGIGGKQTGVYPNNSAGGWNIIGNTPVNFFDTEMDTLCFAKAGDYIKFNAITLDEYYCIKTEIKEKKYKIVKTKQDA